MSLNYPLAFLTVLVLFSCKDETPESSQLDLTPLLSDHMVVQQESTVKLWGNARMGSDVQVKGSWGAENASVADSEGYWEVQLETPVAGGPYNLEIINDDSTAVVNDVLIGDVWLASGQSNMEMPVKGWLPNDPILGSESAIANSANPNVRMFTVPRAFSDSIKREYTGTWEIADPTTTGDFSATAYFFAQKVQEETGIPIGIIHSSWGGTVAEAWTKPEFLKTVDGFQNIQEDLEVSAEQNKLYSAWLDSLAKVDVSNTDDPDRFTNLNLGDTGLELPTKIVANWPKMELPGSWENKGLSNFDGAVWFKKTIDIPENWQAKALLLELGPVDDMDVTFVNGQEVGRTEVPGAWNSPRSYSVPAELNNSDKLSIAFRVLDTGGGGGAYGDSSSMKLILQNTMSKPISLAGTWDYLPVADYQNGAFYKIGTTPEDFDRRPKMGLPQGPNTPTFLYNAMIAPIENYKIKGAIWYQGESNVGRANQYASLFPQMIRSWRDSWKEDFPFYFVQLAPYVYSGDDNDESAELREAQRKSSMLVSNTGMAVTLDVGDARNIHPANKRAVGERLARLALAKTYNKEIIPSGPEIKSATLDDNRIILEFEQYGSDLLPSRLTGFEGAKEDGIFFPIRGRMEENKIMLTHSDIQSVKTIRYAFQNVPKNALIKNKENLPASSFKIEVK